MIKDSFLFYVFLLIYKIYSVRLEYVKSKVEISLNDKIKLNLNKSFKELTFSRMIILCLFFRFINKLFSWDIAFEVCFTF